ncbi:hypothetical protein [Streptomyces sp. CB03911]|uniref:hypothetical protein n=1 Tax=Streptomyces sp. CB03911 TaxID=1804758 RepID=UPI00095BE2DB|nr:hypothetical protein [Streptomyces sp. CB03911]OKI19262.1 hypothetical protein A6A07_07110 [Streptomyces sp. CB03911]
MKATTSRTGYHVRTENGVPALLTTKEALAEVNLVMMDKAAKRSTRTVSARGSSANIEYRDGRKVDIRPATAEDVAVLTPAPAPLQKRGQELRLIVAKGKRYLVGKAQPAVPYTEGATWCRPYAAVNYWTERNGATFGPTLSATEVAKRGTVGAAIWAAVNEAAAK